jgi:hypothetical protein
MTESSHWQYRNYDYAMTNTSIQCPDSSCRAHQPAHQATAAGIWRSVSLTASKTYLLHRIKSAGIIYVPGFVFQYQRVVPPH